MKKHTLLFFAGLLLSGVSVGQYSIKGNLGMGNARVNLMDNRDVLAATDMKNGKFAFTGKVETPLAVKLTLEGQKKQALIFLENKAKYTVSIHPEDSSLIVSGGGELQKLHQEYEKAMQETNRKRAEVVAIAQKADREGKWMEVMHHRAVIENIETSQDSIENRFIKQHPSSELPAYYVYRNMIRLKYEGLKLKYDCLGEAAKNSGWGKAVAKRLQQLIIINPGSKAPNFTLNQPDGTPVTLYDVKGKVKMLDFWASWCGPCRANNPYVLALYNKYKDAGLTIIGISLDSKKEPWEKAVLTDNLPWMQVSSLKGWKCPVAEEYRIISIPTMILLDEDNRILLVKPTDSALEAMLEEKLK